MPITNIAQPVLTPVAIAAITAHTMAVGVFIFGSVMAGEAIAQTPPQKGTPTGTGPGSRGAYQSVVCGKANGVDGPNRIIISLPERKKNGNGFRQAVVRMSWVYAPEEPQEGAFAARVALSRIISGHDVCVDVVSTLAPAANDAAERWRYVGVARIKGLNDHNDVGLEMIRQGRAWHYIKYAGSQPGPDRSTYAAAQEKAKADKAGIWNSNPIPPWKFSKGGGGPG